MLLARTAAKQAVLVDARADADATDLRKQEGREEKCQAVLERQLTAYSKATKTIEVVPIVTDLILLSGTKPPALAKLVSDHLSGLSLSKQTDVLKEQIERFVYGMGFSDLRPASYPAR